ncbi:MAG: hypothetical protein P4N60_11150 [Verrucomicrobiae bacterium]|nr:hypothetical protein [Verrucomicrobiae bacterium]
MNFITRANAHHHALKVHVKLTDTKTLCGVVMTAAQEDIGPANCKRCQRCQQPKMRRRSTVRLNGRRVSPNQTKLIE